MLHIFTARNFTAAQRNSADRIIDEGHAVKCIEMLNDGAAVILFVNVYDDGADRTVTISTNGTVTEGAR